MGPPHRRAVARSEQATEQVRAVRALDRAPGRVSKLAAELKRRGIGSGISKTRNGIRRGGGWLGRGALCDLLQNLISRDMAVHEGTTYPAEHQPIVPQVLWDRVHSLLEESRTRHGHVVAAGSALPPSWGEQRRILGSRTINPSRSPTKRGVREVGREEARPDRPTQSRKRSADPGDRDAKVRRKRRKHAPFGARSRGQRRVHMA